MSRTSAVQARAGLPFRGMLDALCPPCLTANVSAYHYMEIATRKFVCPCCGYSELARAPYERMGLPPWLDHGTPPYSQRYGEPSYDICECCGFEFGNDDEPGTASPKTFSEHLRGWIAGGCVWFMPHRKLEGWSLGQQLRRAGIEYDNQVC